MAPKASLASRSSPKHRGSRKHRRPRDHNLWAAVAIQPLDVGIGSYSNAARVDPYRSGGYGDTVGAARRDRRTPAQKGAGARLTGLRMADWARNPRGHHLGDEGYNNEPFCPPGTA